MDIKEYNFGIELFYTRSFRVSNRVMASKNQKVESNERHSSCRKVTDC